MNINKITQKMYIDYFKESKYYAFHEFIKNKLKTDTSKIECIINCYMLFTVEDWINIIQWKIFKDLIIDYPELSIYGIICESHKELLAQINNENTILSQRIYDIDNSVKRLYTIIDNIKNNNIKTWTYTSNNSGV